MSWSSSAFCMLVAVLVVVSSCSAWSPIRFGNFAPFNRNVNHVYLEDNDNTSSEEQQQQQKEVNFQARRTFLTAAAMNVCLVGAAPVVAGADDGSAATVYKSGKAPIVPGKKPKDKNDLKGTRKDPDFLRSVADCRNQCQSTNGPDGYARSKEDCLSDCQDICCSTYEQCTFNIVPRL